MAYLPTSNHQNHAFIIGTYTIVQWDGTMGYTKKTSAWRIILFATRFTTKVSFSSPFCLMEPLPFHGLRFLWLQKKWRSDPIRSPFTTPLTAVAHPPGSESPDLAAGRLVRSDLKYHRVPHRSGLGRIDGFSQFRCIFFRDAKKNCTSTT